MNVECIAESEDVYEMEWTRVSAKSRAKTYKSYNKILMEIKGMIPMDFGKYICSAKRSDGEITTNSITFKRNKNQGSGFDYEIEYDVKSSQISQPVAIKEKEESEHDYEEPEEDKKDEDLDDENSLYEHKKVLGNINNDRTIRIVEEFQTYTHEGFENFCFDLI